MTFDKIHDLFIKTRRVHILHELLMGVIPEDVTTILDVGCGDGAIAAALMSERPDLRITGIDPLVREGCDIPVLSFDGRKIPFEDSAFDYCLFVDVLHHADDPLCLLKEAARVARRGVIIKDHFVQGLFARQTLRFMDDTHNRRYGVSLPYNYWTPSQWDAAYAEAGLSIGRIQTRLGLYPFWADWIFGRGLHFVAKLDRAR